jgi:hypothetical protein
MRKYSRILEQSVAGIRQRQGGGRIMKTLALQLITVGLENGHQGVFVGWPLIPEKSDNMGNQVRDIWFSNVQDVPDDLTLKQLLELVRKHICNCNANIQ